MFLLAKPKYIKCIVHNYMFGIELIIAIFEFILLGLLNSLNLKRIVRLYVHINIFLSRLITFSITNSQLLLSSLSS